MSPDRRAAPAQSLLLALAFSFCLTIPSIAAAERGWKLDELIGSDAISLRFEHRTRYEGLSDPFRVANAGKVYTDVIAMRTLVHGRVKLPAGFTIGAELQDSRAFRNGDTILNSTTVNSAELLRAYLEFKGDVDGGTLTARGGRITMDVGSRRFVARNRYRNTINGFTGIDLDWHGDADRDNLNVRAFFTLPVQREPNPQSPANRRNRLRDNDVVFDTESFDVLFWGLFAARDLDEALGLEGVRGEVFLFGLHESDASDRPTRNRQLFTPGFRVFRKPAKALVDFTVEAALQAGQSRATGGSTRELDHLAGFVHGTLGYTFDAPWSPRLALRFDYASGDSSAGDGTNERFDTLFGARRFEWGPTGIYGPFARANLITPGLRVQIKPCKEVTAFTSVRSYWLASKTDGWTTSGVADPQGESGDHLGTQIELRVRWRIVPKTILLEAGYAHLFAGEYIDTNSLSSNSNRQGDSDYVYTQAKFNF
jgi:hypothetical protein